MSIQKSGRNRLKATTSNSRVSYHLLRVRNHSCEAAAKSRLATVAEMKVSRKLPMLSTSISSNCVLKMNINGSTLVRMLYQNAVKPVSNGSVLAMPAAA